MLEDNPVNKTGAFVLLCFSVLCARTCCYCSARIKQKFVGEWSFKETFHYNCLCLNKVWCCFESSSQEILCVFNLLITWKGLV